VDRRPARLDVPQGGWPSAIVIHEVPGIKPKVIAFAEEVVAGLRAGVDPA
jgi:dienelactone hydrolase